MASEIVPIELPNPGETQIWEGGCSLQHLLLQLFSVRYCRLYLTNTVDAMVIKWFDWHHSKTQNPEMFLTVMTTQVQGSHSLEKSLNYIFLWKVLKFMCKSLKSAWIFFNFECSGMESVFWCFKLSKTEFINHSSENLKVIYIKCSMFHAIIKYQEFKTSKLKNVAKLVKQTVQVLKPY